MNELLSSARCIALPSAAGNVEENVKRLLYASGTNQHTTVL